MRLKKLLLTISASIAMVLGAIAIVIACAPSPLPPQCPQSIFLAKFAPSIFIIPEDGEDFDVALGMFPFVSWDAVTEGCSVPVAASLDVMLECTDITGAMYSLDETFAMATPTDPGPQPPGGTTVDFPIPGDVLPSTCDVVADYEVIFGGGIGTSPLTARGDLQICLVEPSPSDPSGDTPRLDLELLTPEPLPGRGGENGTYTFHAGDQEYIYIRIENNDLENKLEIDFESIGRQMSIFPFLPEFDSDEEAYAAGVFRISDPEDTFPAEFFFDDNPLPFDRLPGDPGTLGDGKIETRIELGPGEVEIFGIAINSFGACSDGSCNERTLCGTGIFFDDDGNEVARDPACVQFAYVVDNAQPPRYPGITFDQEIKVAPFTDSQWSEVSFFDGDDLIDKTHKSNLLEQNRGVPGDEAVQVTGNQIPQEPTQPQFSDQWFDTIVLPRAPTSAQWDALFFIEEFGFQQRANQTILEGLDELDQECNFPAITLNNPLNPANNAVRVEADVSDGCGGDTFVRLFEGNQQVQQGTLDELKEDGNIRIDFDTCLTLRPRDNVLDKPFMVADPPFVVHNFEAEDEDPLARAIRILDELERELEWRVDFEPLGTPGGVAIIGNQGRGTSNIVIDPSVLDTGNPYDEIAGFLIYENDEAVNSPLAVPVLTRRLPPPLPPLPLPDYDLDLPPLGQVGQPFNGNIFIPPLDPQPVDPYFNMEFFIGLQTEDPIQLTIPQPFEIVVIDPNTPAAELERLRGKFGEDPINRCSEGVWKCGKIEFGDGFTFESEIFADGFESGDFVRWDTRAAADNSQRKDKDENTGVLDDDKKLPVFTEEELREAIELFNDDVVFDEKTIGLVSERFGIEVPLPPIRGTYFFDEFESFRKTAQAPVTIDGSNCPRPCSGLVIEGSSTRAGGGVSNIRFQNFPNHGLEIINDSLWIASNEFSGNGLGGILINGNNNFVSDSLLRANRFETNGGPGITVEGGTGNRLLFNEFTDGTGTFIDLGGDGRTDNDDGDRDEGANGLQNFPVLTRVLMGGSTTIQGTLNSTPDADFTLQFFAWSDTLTRFLGETTVRTDASGNVSFDVVVDGTAEIGQEVYATATDAAGNTSEYSDPFVVVSGVATEGPEDVPATFRLEQNYPNPFNPSTRIRYAVPEASRVRLTVFDMLGRRVMVLVDELKPSGSYEVVFDASHLPSGTYFYTMTGDGFSQTKTLMLVK